MILEETAQTLCNNPQNSEKALQGTATSGTGGRERGRGHESWSFDVGFMCFCVVVVSLEETAQTSCNIPQNSEKTLHSTATSGTGGRERGRGHVS